VIKVHHGTKTVNINQEIATKHGLHNGSLIICQKLFIKILNDNINYLEKMRRAAIVANQITDRLMA